MSDSAITHDDSCSALSKFGHFSRTQININDINDFWLETTLEFLKYSIDNLLHRYLYS